MASPLAAAWPRARIPKYEVWSGYRFNRNRFGSVLTGILSAFFMWIQERYLPWWFTLGRLLLDNVWRMYVLDGILVRTDVAPDIRSLAPFVRVVWFTSVLRYVPDGLQLLIDAGVSRFILGAIAAWIEYLQSDCPPGKEQASWEAQYDATSGFFIFIGGVAYPTHLISIVYKTAFWIFMLVVNWASEWNSGFAMLTAVLGLDTYALMSPIIERMPSWFYWPGRIIILSIISVILQKVRFRSFDRNLPLPEWSRIPGLIVMKLMLLEEVYEYLEVAMLEYVPRSLQKRLYYYQKEQRKARTVHDYQYVRLKPGEIRLLVLRKATLPICGTLEAEMIHVPLSPDLEYEAASYRWGNPALIEEILVEGSRLKITLSAFEVLLSHRSSVCERAVWIDAICINQADDQEKSEQVQIMHEIYRTASRVILFPHSDWRARLAVGLIYQHGLGPPAKAQSAQALDLRDIMLEGRPAFAPRWEAMARLLSHEYFNRAWIVQEIAVAQKVELCLGGVYIPWDIFYRAVLMLQQPAKIARLHNDHFKPPIGMLHFHDVYFLNSLRPDSPAANYGLYRTHAELTQLESVLYITSDFRTSDPRDKVYAILGIVNGIQSGLPLRPDYTMSVEQVFETVASYLFRDQDYPSINILTFAGYGYPNEEHLKQSWVPHLLQSRSRIPFTNLLLRNPRFRACGETKVGIAAGTLPGSLLIEGRLCDTILVISSAEPPKSLQVLKEIGPDISTLQIIEFMDIAVKLIQDHPSHFPSHPLAPDSRIWHALIADSDLSISHEDFQGWQKSLYDFIPTNAEPAERLLRVRQALSHDPGHLLYCNHMGEACAGRRFAVTQAGRLCLIPPKTRAEDVVFVPSGAQTPYIFRKEIKENTSYYILIGEAYVQGIMQGEMMADLEELTAITVL